MQLEELRQAPPVVYHMGMEMERLMDIHWEISHLVQNQELIQVIMLVDQMVKMMENLRDLHWGILGPRYGTVGGSSDGRYYNGF